jgi:broad specificity phosphatase PhoE
VAPERRARETAAALVLDATVEADLADIDMGGWRGRRLEEIQASEPGTVGAWMGDPDAAPPNGESVAAARVRVGRWLDEVGHDPEDRPLVVVTHTAVVRLALLSVLDAPIAAFASIDAPALSATELRHDGTRWALRGHGIGLGPADA